MDSAPKQDDGVGAGENERQQEKNRTLSTGSSGTGSEDQSAERADSDIDPKAELNEEYIIEQVVGMGRFFAAIIAAVAWIAFIFFLIGFLTQSWLNLKNNGGRYNPVLINAQLSNPKGGDSAIRRIEYFALSIGLINTCYTERKGITSCAWTGFNCKSTVCWYRRRKNGQSTQACRNAKVSPLKFGQACTGYQVSRVFAILTVIATGFAASLAVIAIVIPAPRPVEMGSGLFNIFAGICGVIQFSVFYAVVFINSGVHKYSYVGWSFFFTSISAPFMIVAGILALLNAAYTESNRPGVGNNPHPHPQPQPAM